MEKLCIVQPTINSVSETFLKAQAEMLPFATKIVYFKQSIPHIGSVPVLSQKAGNRVLRKINRFLNRRQWDWEVTDALKKVFSKDCDVVMAQYGTTAVKCLQAAKLAGVPFVVHFHGYDATKYEVLAKHKESYQELFSYATAIIAVSRKMVGDLSNLGAPLSKIFLNPCGVDTNLFKDACVIDSDPILIAVGRFVHKKAPYLTLMAFSKALSHVPDARLRFLGDGPLLPICKNIASGLKIEKSVDFLGACSHETVLKEMANSRGFVQHSILAHDGDCEGTPVSVMEAQSSGLPVIATNHAGISDVVIHGDTGYLVEEKDILSMGQHMTEVLKDPLLASQLGRNGAKRIRENYSMEISICRLAEILSRPSNSQ